MRRDSSGDFAVHPSSPELTHLCCWRLLVTVLNCLRMRRKMKEGDMERGADEGAGGFCRIEAVSGSMRDSPIETADDWALEGAIEDFPAPDCRTNS